MSEQEDPKLESEGEPKDVHVSPDDNDDVSASKNVQINNNQEAQTVADGEDDEDGEDGEDGEESDEPKNLAKIRELEAILLKDYVKLFKEGNHQERVKLIEDLSFSGAWKILNDYPEIPEGYKGLINNRCRYLLHICFPNHYYKVKDKKNVNYFDELMLEMDRIRESVDPKYFGRQDPAPVMLNAILDVLVTCDLEARREDFDSVQSLVFSDHLDLLYFCQNANMDLLKYFFERVRYKIINVNSRKRWFLIIGKKKILRSQWEKWKRGQGRSANWLMFFKMEIIDILKYGSEDVFFFLIDYLEENGIKFVRHKPYLATLLPTIVKFQRYDIFKKLTENYRIKDYDWFSLIKEASDTGQIAMTELLLDYEEKYNGLDRTKSRFEIMIQSAQNGYSDAFCYYFGQCSDEELKQVHLWCQGILSAIVQDDFNLFKFIFEHPYFDINQTTIDASYAETKDDPKMKEILNEMTPQEQLAQKCLFTKNDSSSSFKILRYIMEKYVGNLDLNAFNEFHSDEFRMKKRMMLFKSPGHDKKYLCFSESFFTSPANIRKFFHLFNFSSQELEQNTIRIIYRIYDLDYKLSEKAIKQFNTLCYGADCFVEEENLLQAMIRILTNISKSASTEKLDHRQIIESLLEKVSEEGIDSPSKLLSLFVDTLSSSKDVIDSKSDLDNVLAVFSAKVGTKPIIVSKINAKIRENIKNSTKIK